MAAPPSNAAPSTTTDESLTSAEIERYSRQLLLPQFGVRGQKRLRSSRALIVGVGGLGCPAALYLAGAGVSVLGLVDRPRDVVERSNLHRQVAHAENRVGTNKVQSAEISIRALNSDVQIEKHDEIVPGNAVQLVGRYDVVLDCTDNVMSRYLVSDACAAANVPLVSGSAIGMEGQLTVYCSGEDTPCYRCIFPQPPPPSCVGSCDSAGVLGPVPGIIGTMQALEALKLLAQIQRTNPLERKLLLFDAADSAFRSVKLRARSEACPACGDNPTVDVASFDYDKFALGIEQHDDTKKSNGNADATAAKQSPSPRLTVEEFSQMRKDPSKYRLIDVRPQAEFEMCHLAEAKNYPLATLSSSGLFLDADNSEQYTVFLCRRGNASQKALQLALNKGKQNVVDVVGGLQSWHHHIDSNFPLY